MKCELCENEATIFLTEWADGGMRKRSLCEDCAREHAAVEQPSVLELTDLLLGLGTPGKKVKLAEDAAEQDLLCPHCGFTEKDFDQSERLGCPQCYGVFAERLNGMWKTFQHDSHHTGKRPADLSRALGGESEASAEPAKPKITAPAQEQGGDVFVPLAAKPKGVPRPAVKDPQESIDALQEKITQLEARMEEALKEENYELAAQVRDDLRSHAESIRKLEKRREEELAAHGGNGTAD